MKKLLIGTLAGITITVYATPAEDLQAERLRWSANYYKNQNMPVPDGGITIVPAKGMNSHKEHPELLAKILSETAQFGYVKSATPGTEHLLNIQIIAAHDYKRNEANYKPKSTHLRHEASELKLAFTFKPIPQEELTESIGFVPAGTYIRGEGWTSAIQFFSKEGMGNCQYYEDAVKLSHASIIIPEELAREEVKGKVTTIDITGNEASGFLYTVEWYDEIFFKKLECAGKKYSNEVTMAMIALANRID
jgi:hypothetical protein